MHKSILYKLGLKIKRKLAEWFKATSLKLVKNIILHVFESHTF